jgi:hypothetical protein
MTSLRPVRKSLRVVNLLGLDFSRYVELIDLCVAFCSPQGNIYELQTYGIYTILTLSEIQFQFKIGLA